MFSKNSKLVGTEVFTVTRYPRHGGEGYLASIHATRETAAHAADILTADGSRAVVGRDEIKP